MKTLKLNMLFFLAIFSFSVCSAQNEKSKKTLEEKSTAMTEKLDKELTLSPTQKPKIKAINTAYLKSKKELDDKIKALETSKKELKKKRKEKINLILTEDQKKKALKKKKKRKK